jgi:hypothetical protein
MSDNAVVDPNRLAMMQRMSAAIIAAISTETATYPELCSVLESVKILAAPVAKSEA